MIWKCTNMPVKMRCLVKESMKRPEDNARRVVEEEYE